MEKKEQTISYTTAKHRVLRQKNISIIDPPTQMRTERNMTVQSRRLFMAALTHCLCIYTTGWHPFWGSIFTKKYIFLIRWRKEGYFRNYLSPLWYFCFEIWMREVPCFFASLLFNPTCASTNYADFVATWCFSYNFFTIQSNASLNQKIGIF